jgi:hypothetical protein
VERHGAKQSGNNYLIENDGFVNRAEEYFDDAVIYRYLGCPID